MAVKFDNSFPKNTSAPQILYVVFFLLFIFLKIYLWTFYAFNWTRRFKIDRQALGEERGERDRQRTMIRDECSGSVCRRSNREAIGADNYVFIIIILCLIHIRL